ncbi:hypothetical protein [Desulfobulbus propionicus]
MAYKKGKSEKKTDWLGNKYIQHYDSKGNKSGKSVSKEGFFGNKYTQHYDSKGEKRGKSEKKEGFFGNKYTQKYDSKGEKSGRSEKKKGFFGNKYTQHYDVNGNKTDRSVSKEGFWGNRYVERTSETPESSSQGKSEYHSISSGGYSSGNSGSSGDYYSGRSASASFFGVGKVFFIIICIGLGLGIIRTLTKSSQNSHPPATKFIQQGGIASSPKTRQLYKGTEDGNQTPSPFLSFIEAHSGGVIKLNVSIVETKHQNINPRPRYYNDTDSIMFWDSDCMDFTFPISCNGSHVLIKGDRHILKRKGNSFVLSGEFAVDPSTEMHQGVKCYLLVSQ